MAYVYNLSLPGQISNTLVRLGMNGVLVLAMLPGIQCGISLNLGLPIGIIGGIIGGLLCIEFGFSGWFGFLFAVVVGLAISAVTGCLYGMLLNRLKGSEMSVTTYVGFSIVSLMCIAWLVLPFKSKIMKWPLGNGLRTTIGLQTSYRHLLNDFLSFKIFGVTVPTGLLLFFALCCFLVWLFMRSKTGIAMSAAGANPRFAEATGINVDKMRIIERCFPPCLVRSVSSSMRRALGLSSSIRRRARWAFWRHLPSCLAVRRRPAQRSATLSLVHFCFRAC